jgi:amino acid transporter
MVSMFPNSGGIVGFGRFAMGHTIGFICGIIECVTLYLNVVLATTLWAQYIADLTNIDYKSSMFTLWTFLAYLLPSLIITVGGKFMWNWMLLSSAVMLLVILLFYITAMIYGDFNANAFQLNVPTDDPVYGGPAVRIESKQWFVDGLEGFYVTLSYTLWYLGGIECSAVAGEEIENVSLLNYTIMSIVR